MSLSVMVVVSFFTRLRIWGGEMVTVYGEVVETRTRTALEWFEGWELTWGGCAINWVANGLLFCRSVEMTGWFTLSVARFWALRIRCHIC